MRLTPLTGRIDGNIKYEIKAASKCRIIFSIGKTSKFEHLVYEPLKLGISLN